MMSSIRRFFLWYGLLSKRLLRRPGYLAVLLLIPLFALALALFSRQESGVVTVALCLEEPADAAARTTAERLLNAESILRCSAYPDPEAAREAVRSGQADAAWILPADLEKRLDFFARYGSGGSITVVEREENVFLMLAREKLYAALYPELSFSVFRNYLVNELGADALPEETLRGAYAGGFTTDKLIRFASVDGSEIELKEDDDDDYIPGIRDEYRSSEEEFTGAGYEIDRSQAVMDTEPEDDYFDDEDEY